MSHATISKRAELEALRKSEISHMIDPKTNRVYARLVRRRNCPVCDSNSFTYFFLKEGFDHVLCNNCTLLYVPDILKQSVLSKVYNSDHHTEMWELKSSDPESLHYKRKYFEHKARHIERFTAPGKVVDVGCGVGDFLKVMKARGWDPVGLEFNAYARRFVQEQYHIPAKNKQLGDMPAMKYTLVSMSRLLEHIPDPKKLIRDAHRVLKRGGVLFLSFPHRDGLTIRLLEKYAPRFKGREHLNFFSRKTISHLLEDCNFEVLFITSETLDLYSMINFLFNRRVDKLNPTNSSSLKSKNRQNSVTPLLSIFFYGVLTPFAAGIAKLFGVGDELVVIAKKV